MQIATLEIFGPHQIPVGIDKLSIYWNFSGKIVIKDNNFDVVVEKEILSHSYGLGGIYDFIIIKDVRPYVMAKGDIKSPKKIEIIFQQEEPQLLKHMTEELRHTKRSIALEVKENIRRQFLNMEFSEIYKLQEKEEVKHWKIWGEECF